MPYEYVKLIDKPPFVKLSSANRLSDDVLDNAEMHLRDNFDKVIRHQCILYKEEGKKESFCIPDFICSNNKDVIIVDAKIIPATEKKLNQYKELISFILIQRNDTRNVSATHLFLILPNEPLH